MKILSLITMILLVGVCPAPANPIAASYEIDSLLAFVGRQEGIVFVRNGTAHTASEAESHMRLKLRRGGSRIKTAEDFIKYCATRSSFTGIPYRIRYTDGTVKTAESVLMAELKRLRQQGNQVSP